MFLSPRRWGEREKIFPASFVHISYSGGIISCNYASLGRIILFLLIFSRKHTHSYVSISGTGFGLRDGHHSRDGQAVPNVDQPGGGHQHPPGGEH